MTRPQKTLHFHSESTYKKLLSTKYFPSKQKSSCVLKFDIILKDSILDALSNSREDSNSS